MKVIKKESVEMSIICHHADFNNSKCSTRPTQLGIKKKDIFAKRNDEVSPSVSNLIIFVKSRISRIVRAIIAGGRGKGMREENSSPEKAIKKIKAI